MNELDRDGIFYSGCWNEPGHFLHRVDGYHLYEQALSKDFPVRPDSLDGAFLPQRQQIEGRGVLLHFPGWTLLTFWDRSVDKRYNSCSAFVMRGKWTFEETVAHCKQWFPQVWERFKFPVTEAQPL